MKFPKVLLFCFCIALITACSNSTEPAETGVIQPLAVGNYWIYKVTPINNYVPGESHYDTVRIVSQQSLNNEYWYKSTTLMADLHENHSSYLANRKGGLYSMDTADVNWNALVAKYPAKSGDTFFMYNSVMFGTNDTLRFYGQVKSTNVQVTVPAGSYRCYKYTTELKASPGYQLSSDYASYYSPNIGLVKIENYEGSLQKANGLIKELLEYKVQ